MKPRDLPVIHGVIEAGPNDRVFDGLLLVGPLVVGVLVLFERGLLTVGIAGTYLAVFCAYVVYKAVQRAA